MQLATEPRGPGVPTSGDILLAVVYIADIMKGKESSKKKDMNLYRIWKSLLSIQLPLNLVQVSINQNENASIQPKPQPSLWSDPKPTSCSFICTWVPLLIGSQRLGKECGLLAFLIWNVKGWSSSDHAQLRFSSSGFFKWMSPNVRLFLNLWLSRQSWKNMRLFCIFYQLKTVFLTQAYFCPSLEARGWSLLPFWEL